MNHLLIGLWCVMKGGFYSTTGDDQLSCWTEKKFQSTSQSQTCTKKDHGHCLVVCCWYYPLQLSESWQNHYLWEVCSASWRDASKPAGPAAGIGSRMSQILLRDNACHLSHNWCFRRWTNRSAEFCFIHRIHLISHQPTTTLWASQQLFAGKVLPQPAGGRKCFPGAHWILKHGCLHYRNKQTYFLLAKMCWL